MGEASQQQPECRNVGTLVQAGDTFQDFVDTIWRLRARGTVSRRMTRLPKT